MPHRLGRVLTAAGCLGLAAGAYAALFLRPDQDEVRALVFLLVFPAPLLALGVFALRSRPDLPIARLLLLNGSLLCVMVGTEGLAHGLFDQGVRGTGLLIVTVVAATSAQLWMATAATLLGLFPDGRFRFGYERLLVGLLWSLALVSPLLLIAGETAIELGDVGDLLVVSNPVAVEGLSWLAPLAGAVGGLWMFVGLALLASRYVRGSAEDRAKTRWLLVVPLAGLVAVGLGAVSGFTRIETPAADAIAWGIEMAFLLLVTAALAVAVLRHRVLDVDVLLRRSVVYGALWLSIAGAYVGIAAAFGIAAGERLPVSAAVLLTIAVTLLFQPARRRLEGLADRWVFGERISGYELLTGFGATLEQTFDPSELLPRLADTVRQGMRARWTRVMLRVEAGERSRLEPAAQNGATPGPDERATLSVPVIHAGHDLGVLECGPREEGSYSESDRELLVTLARQAAVAIRNARLTAELSAHLDEIRRQAAELAASRARIVQAQEAERRRMERDIHDGLQQELVALIAHLGLTRGRLRHDPAAAERTISELQDQAEAALEDLRELVHGIHPPLLADRGLVAAVEERAARLPLPVTVRANREARSLRLEEGVESAAYFLVSEALANVMKHAEARHAAVEISLQGDRLAVEVTDDGRGFDRRDGRGAGLTNLADRLDALDGRLAVAAGPGGGTTIRGELPARPRAPERTGA